MRCDDHMFSLHEMAEVSEANNPRLHTANKGQLLTLSLQSLSSFYVVAR